MRLKSFNYIFLFPHVWDLECGHFGRTIRKFDVISIGYQCCNLSVAIKWPCITKDGCKMSFGYDTT